MWNWRVGNRVRGSGEGLAKLRGICGPMHVEVMIVVHQCFIADVAHFKWCVVVHRVCVAVMAVMTVATMACVGAVMTTVVTVSVMVVPDWRVGTI